MRLRFTLRLLVLFALAPFETLQAAPPPPAASPEGRWITTDNQATVEITLVDHRLVGRIVALTEPLYPSDDPDAGKVKFDRENPEPARRARPILGLPVLEGLVLGDNGRWEGGTVYDPEIGRTYSCKLRVTEKGTLDIRGYWGISLFGRTEVWTRAGPNVPPPGPADRPQPDRPTAPISPAAKAPAR